MIHVVFIANCKEANYVSTACHKDHSRFLSDVEIDPLLGTLHQKMNNSFCHFLDESM